MGSPTPASEVADPYPELRVTPELRSAMAAGQSPLLASLLPAVGEPLSESVVVSEAQARWLAQRIGDGSGAENRLKYGYFRQTLPGRWPPAEALAMLEAERENAAAGNRRLALMEVVAYGRAVTPPYDGWQAAYRTLWTQAGQWNDHPDVFERAVHDYADISLPGPHRRTRAAAGEIQFFLENALPRWLLSSVREEGIVARPDWAGLATHYLMESTLWGVVDALEARQTDNTVFHRRAAEIGLSEIHTPRDTRVFDPDRALRHLRSVMDSPDFPRTSQAFQTGIFSGLARSREARSEWMEALSAWESAMTAGAGFAEAARFSLRAFRAAADRGDREAANIFRARAEAWLARGSAPEARPEDALMTARVWLETDATDSRAIELLDRLLAQDDLMPSMRHQAAMERLAAAARSGDREIGRRMLEIVRAPEKADIRPDPLDPLLMVAYAAKLGLTLP